MTKNNFLNLGIILCEFLRWLYVIAIIFLVGVFIHLQINPSFYNDYHISTESGNIFTSSIQVTKSTDVVQEKIHTSTVQTMNSKNFDLNSLKKFSLFCMFLQLIICLLCMFWVFSEFEKVIKSVKNLQTFQENNVKSFRKIGRYFIVIFIFSSFHYIATEMEIVEKINETSTNERIIENFRTEFHIDLLYLAVILVSFILAEIFKEGNKLQEENQLTV